MPADIMHAEDVDRAALESGGPGAGDDGHRQALSRRAGARERRPDARARQGACADGRERRRQIDADQDHGRRLQQDAGTIRIGGREVGHTLAARQPQGKASRSCSRRSR